MKKYLIKIKQYVFRSWEDEPGNIHPQLRILPPILFDILSVLILIVIIFLIVDYFFSIIL